MPSIIDILMDKIGELEFENRTIKNLARAVLGDLEPKLMTENERALDVYVRQNVPTSST